MAEQKELLECKWAAKFDSGITIGSSSQTAAPTAGIAVHDVRDATVTPDSFGDKNANFYFDQVGGRWASVLHMKGWTGSYAAWELSGNAHNNSNDNTLKYRQGIGDTWGDWQTVLTDKNVGDYVDDGDYLPLSGGTLTGKLTLPTNLYYASGDTAGLDCQNSDIINANGVYFKDACDSAGEGINFYRGSDTWDRLYSYNGALYYAPNVGTNTFPGTRYTVYHSGIACMELYSGTLTSGSITFNYGNYNAYVIIGQAATNMARISAYIPKNVLTTTATRYQIADETYYCSFNLSYSDSTVTLSYHGSNGSGRILYVYGIN